MIHKRFKHFVNFHAEMIFYNGVPHLITAELGLDIDENKLQMRDDIILVHRKTKKFISFEHIMRDWHLIEPMLIKIIKRGGFVRQN